MTNSAKTVYNLIELTQESRILWKQMYPNSLNIQDEDDFIKETEPVGFMADDQHHGFGRVILKLVDHTDSAREPVLYVNGKKVPAPSGLITALLDAIDLFMSEIQSGNRPGPEDDITRILNQSLKPVDDKLSQLAHSVDVMMNHMGQQQEIIYNLTATVANLTQENVDKTETPLTIDTLTFCLQTLAGEENAALVSKIYDADRLADAIDETTVAYNKKHMD